MALIGRNAVLANLNKEIRKIEGRTKQGMAVAAALIKARSMEKTPVEFGNLKAGHYTSSGGTRFNPIAEIGTTSEYSTYVHENLENHHPVGEAKFLEKAVDESRDDIVRIVQKRAKVK